MEKTIKVVSYNIHSGEGVDGILDLDRIAKLISDEDADLIGLNEVDRGTSRSEDVDQIEYIAEKLGYYYAFGKAIDHDGGSYGNAFLSRYPIVSSNNHRLPIHSSDTQEPRAMLECDVDIGDNLIKVFTTHLGLTDSERKLSIEYIEYILKDIQTDTILLGDFNIRYDSGFDIMEPLLKTLKDTAVDVGKANEIKTFHSQKPIGRIDYILVSKAMKVLSTYTIPSIASDHLPVICELEI